MRSDKVQDDGVQRVPEGGGERDQTENPVRYFAFRSLRSHNAHVAVGQLRAKRCRVCKYGMAAIFTKASPTVAAEAVDKGGGTDGEGSTASSRSDAESGDWADTL